MSAFLVPPEHIGALVKFAIGGGPHARRPRWRNGEIGRDDFLAICHDLAEENARSVASRYREPVDPVVFPSVVPSYYADLTPMEAFKAIHCLEYQSCEHDEWEQSSACQFLRALADCAMSRLPGYQSADVWPISRKAGEPARTRDPRTEAWT